MRPARARGLRLFRCCARLRLRRGGGAGASACAERRKHGEIHACSVRARVSRGWGAWSRRGAGVRDTTSAVRLNTVLAHHYFEFLTREL